MTTATDLPGLVAPPQHHRAPGVLLCLAPAVLAYAVSRVVPLASPALVAVLLGVGVGTFLRPGPRTAPGLAFASRTLLRAGIVLLGLQLSLRQVTDLGPGVVVLIAGVVVSGIAVSTVVGRLLGLSWTRTVLIGCGFSICGAAAIAAAGEAVDAEEEETAGAVALVVVFGSAMIGLLPLAAALVGLDPRTAGIWAGASIHEVGQVVAAGSLVGGGALAVAVVVKLGRVLMLAPVIAWVTWQRRTRLRATGSQVALPPLVPGFVLGFLAMVLLRTAATPPAAVLDVAQAAQTVLLAAAMFALGCATRPDRLRGSGRAAVLALVATVWVTGVGLAGALLLG